MDYSNYDSKDFINDDTFIRWVLKGENPLFWKQFLLANPKKETAILEAKAMLLQLSQIEQLEPNRLDQEKIWDKIQSATYPITIPRRSFTTRLRQTPFLWAAASVLFLLGISWSAWQSFHKESITYSDLVAVGKENLQLTEQINPGETPLKVQLPDGSTVTLEKKSKISYPAQFNSSKREVFLSGDAFFEVTKNPSKPFYVYANELVTKVLGTSFRIQTGDSNKQVVVKVRTGQVSVFKQSRVSLADPERSGLVLLPNQEVIYNRASEQLSKKLVETPLPVNPLPLQRATQHYDEVSVTQVFKKMEEVYAVKLIYNSELLSNCFITTTLSNESIYDKLELICSTIGATYKEVDAQIVIETDGCR